MGLVDYPESESETEAPPVKAPPAPKTTSTGKKPFQKVVDRSNPGKILVNLPSGSTAGPSSDEPPAKRARTGDAAGGGRFSGFNSFLPPPKNANKTPTVASSSGGVKPKPGVNLKTSAAPGFSRDFDDANEVEGGRESAGDTVPQRGTNGPTIPAEQKPAEEVKLVGKPMMFRPLSVSRNPKKKPKAYPAAPPKPAASAPLATPAASSKPQDVPQVEPPKKTSLFSLHTEETPEPTTAAASNGVYQPLFASETEAYRPTAEEVAEYASYAGSGPSVDTGPQEESLDIVANDLNLSAAERRELFGRSGNAGQTAKNVINFNMDKEYQHNESMRAAGDQQIHNPVRSIQGGGKHSLRQLVSNVQNQREALEDSFAKGKNNRKEASGRYGW
ncbi:mitotic checkpoint regulator, MAD2B-interacting-domain-containing protein [Emericellopsis atlantica]|uniref:Mitotic checkpoint regulator, MAD2B-interacting-domain-containing protein n=1 Tax=Emericellopsis atlantica TaxID=2614577 RepID=A0A9P7ZKS5_9HYPO|nr:mitotic checkpoint regulator, MAD2B-interacting-domain-containing protein [Emericellopsis atlantica]KAG9253929.1 mitotic checkpoint regulator, MAD2B-interacting-domain-containing protein [Emericellopsis atlantica]